MDEVKENKQPQPQQGEGGGRRRRHRRGGKNKQGGQNNQNGQAQQQAQPQKPQQQKPQPQKPQQPQKQEKQQPQQNNKQKNNNNNANKKPQNQPQQPQQQKKKETIENKDENRKDTYAYALDGNLYINLTNKCSNGCDFCVRNERTTYFGHHLWIRHGDPTPEKVIAQAKTFGDLTRFKEVVFCGFGEPTYKVAEMIALCDFFHEKGLRTRLNTNGQGNLINKRDIVGDLKGKIDFVNISLNASCAEKYQPICRSQYGPSGFEGILEFARQCKRQGVDCRFSIVDCIGEEEVEACKRLAESMKIPLYVRKYIIDS